jgi:mitochondrial splicing suppressor protein 51
MAEVAASPGITCIRCKKPQPNAEEVKNCEECQTAYCSDDCLKADKKKHRKHCRQQTESESESNDNNIKGLVASTNLPFTRLDRGVYLHGRPRRDVFRLLLDCYRLRVEDNINLDGIKAPDSLHAGFQQFLVLAKQRPNFLPAWWDDEAAAQCQAFGTESGAAWYNLERRVTKGEVNEHYDNPLMAMQLRMLGEVVYERGPGGQDGTSMRRMMVQHEREGGAISHISL